MSADFIVFTQTKFLSIRYIAMENISHSSLFKHTKYITRKFNHRNNTVRKCKHGKTLQTKVQAQKTHSTKARLLFTIAVNI